MDIYNCNVCLYNTQWKFMFEEHLKAHARFTYDQFHCTGLINLKCFLCNFETESWSGRFIHLKDVHNIKIENRIWLKINEKQNVSTKNFICKACDYSSSKNVNLRAHIYRVHGPKNQMYKCTECPYKSVMKEYLTVHIKHQHAVDQIQKCPDCDYTTRQKRNLKNHIIRHHIPDEKAIWYYCKQCAFKTKNKSTLTEHKHRKHSSNNDCLETLICPHCTDYTATSKKFLVEHIRYKHTGKWYKCSQPQCDYKTTQYFTLKIHGEKVHNAEFVRRYICLHCSSKFYSNRDLKRHIISKHTPENEIEWFQCKNCTFKAKNSHNLVRHMKSVHTDIKNEYQCLECIYKTTRISYLNRHVKRTHGGSSKISSTT